MKNFILMLFVPVILLTGCTPAMKVTGSWMNKDVVGTGKFKKVFVFTISSNMGARQVVDDAIAAACEEHGLATVKSIDVLTPNYLAGKPEQENILAKIKETGCDAIFTSALMDVQEETRYVPGTTHYSPYSYGGYYGSFYGYYGHMDPFMYDPGYYVEDQTYFIESNLYDVETGDIVWSVQSEAFNPSKLETLARNYADLLVSQLRKEGVIK